MHARADTLVDVLTVEEMLMYTAELKRPLRESTKSKKQAVDALVEDLNLAGCRATRIGNSMHRGISGGQVSPAGVLCA
jgi:ABC-type multidrug transport system ATPase subunit